jgi:hypothetical protein
MRTPTTRKPLTRPAIRLPHRQVGRDQLRQRPGRLRRAGPIAVALISVALISVVLVAAACSQGSSGPRVAGVGSSTPTAQSSGGAHANALAYAQCMRGHGLTDFPDPNASGHIDLKSLHPQPGSDLYADDPRFQAAATACQSLSPIVSASQRQQDAPQILRWAQCMRAHGINVPDPDSNGQFPRDASPDVTSPQFPAAVTACKQYQPGSVQVPSGAGGS